MIMVTKIGLKEALKFYADKADLVILISSSGNSLNMINAARYVKLNKNPLVTFTGFLVKIDYQNMEV